MNTNVILAGIAVVLAVPTTLTLMAEKQSFTEYESIPRLFEGFTADTIQAVVMTKAASDPAPDAAGDGIEELVLLRQGDGWIISETPEHPSEMAGVPALSNRVEDDVLAHFKAIRRDEQALVAVDADEEELERRGLTESTGILVSCLNKDQPIAELFVGKDASGGEWGQDKVKGFFVRRKDRKDIILYEPNPAYWNLTLEPEDWVDKKIHQFDASTVKSFSLKNPKGEITFSREREGEGESAVTRWQAADAPAGVGAVRQQEVENLVSRFAMVNVQRFLGPVGRLSRDPAMAEAIPKADTAPICVSATLDDGTTYSMWVGSKIADKNEFNARFDGPDKTTQRFLTAVGDWMVTPYEKGPKEFFDPPENAVEDGGAKSEDGKPGDGKEK